VEGGRERHRGDTPSGLAAHTGKAKVLSKICIVSNVMRYPGRLDFPDLR
jgi:hypothetical protein